MDAETAIKLLREPLPYFDTGSVEKLHRKLADLIEKQEAEIDRLSECLALIADGMPAAPSMATAGKE